jgi:hypothetical protein
MHRRGATLEFLKQPTEVIMSIKQFVLQSLFVLAGLGALAPGVASAEPYYHHHGHQVCHMHYHHQECHWVH